MKILAFDYGASSGRAMLADFDGQKIELEEIHRFSNDPVMVDGRYYWDILRLFHELKQGLLKADRLGGADSVGIDTWGVDFGLLKDGQLLANPLHYRDVHTENALEELNEVLSREERFALDGLAFNKFNTLCQLVCMQKSGNAALKNADSLLFIPDLFAYFLTGKKYTEFTIASTSELIYAGKNEWNKEIFDKYNINKDLFSNIVSAGTVIGDVKESIKKELDLKHDYKLIASCGHDTASAFVAVPAEDNSVFLSSGTWSLLGTELDKPILSEEACKAGYTNEGGIFNNIRFLKNIMGLWIIQECKRSWERAGETISFLDLAKGANEISPCKFLINPDYEEFYLPGNMPEKIQNFCRKSGGEVPQGKYEIARCVYDSLALTYKHNIKALEKLRGKKFSTLHIVGGGSNNDLLNRVTASATGIKVTAGPGEGTAMGNVLTQLVALKKIKNLKEARQVVRNSTEIKEYQPENEEIFNKAYERFLKLL